MKQAISKNGPPQIRCEAIERYYVNGSVRAVHPTDLEFWAGEYVTIMGPSGSGKSTLLNLIGGLDIPTGGRIVFEGKPLLTPHDLDSLRATKVGHVFQAFNLLPTLTVRENIEVAMIESRLSDSQMKGKSLKLLNEVGMSHRLDHLPTQLSAGERQRVAIARALANDPVVLLADEPTGNLDSENGEVILKFFDRLHKDRGMTLLVVTHSPEVAVRGQRCIRIRDGRVAHDTKMENQCG